MTESEAIKEVKESRAKESPLKIETWDDVLTAISVTRGIDPKQQQSMSKFSNFDNTDERSYYADQLTAIAIAQLRMYGEALYGKGIPNEYDDIAETLAIGFMGYKGFKSEQYKDITSGQPNLDKLKGLPEETQKGILGGIFSRSGKE